MPIRIAVSGEMHGPELPDTIYLLGREKSIQHIEKMLEEIATKNQTEHKNVFRFLILYRKLSPMVTKLHIESLKINENVMF